MLALTPFAPSISWPHLNCLAKKDLGKSCLFWQSKIDNPPSLVVLHHRGHYCYIVWCNMYDQNYHLYFSFLQQKQWNNHYIIKAITSKFLLDSAIRFDI